MRRMLNKIMLILRKDGFLGFCEYSLGFLRGIGYGTSSCESEIASISKFVVSGKVKLCIDVGGNVGDYTAGLRNRFPKSTIYTFEPSQTNIIKLEARYKDDLSVHIIPNALSDVAATVDLYSDEPGSGLSSLVKRDLSHSNIDFETRELVKAIRFEDFWKDRLDSCYIDVLKLDIEGHEIAALNGFGAAIDNIKVIQFEFGGCNIDTRTYLRDFWLFFANKGFKLYRVTPFGAVPVNEYRERDEHFLTTNYFAVAK
jgi:FkbM family methyltransferase